MGCPLFLFQLIGVFFLWSIVVVVASDVLVSTSGRKMDAIETKPTDQIVERVQADKE